MTDSEVGFAGLRLRRNRYFTPRPESHALYAELIRSVLAFARTLEFRALDSAPSSSADLLARIASHERVHDMRTPDPEVRRYVVSAALGDILTNVTGGFDDYPGDMELLRADDDPILFSVCAANSVGIRLDDGEYSAWRSGRSAALLALLDAPDPGKVVPVGPFLHSRHNDARLSSTLQSWSPVVPAADRARIADYLDGAEIIMGGPDTWDVMSGEIIVIGHQVLSDGIWAWTREAAHYVRNYGTGLSELFIEHVRAEKYTPAQLSEQHEQAIEDFLWERYDSSAD